MSGYQYQCEDAVEPISDTFGEQATNAVLYNVVNGCAVTPSASDLTVATAIGVITGFSATAAVAASASAWTLIPDASLPRWAWLAYGLTGTPALVQGDPASPPTVPELGDRVAAALYYIQAALTLAANATYKLDKRVPAPEQKHLHNWKTATQGIGSPTTTLVAIAGAATTGATAGVFSFNGEANGVYEVQYWLPLTFGGTGGAKFQITGPATPTLVDITGEYVTATGGGAFVSLPFVTVSAFATDINSGDSGATAGHYMTTPCFINIRARITIGATAGEVTLVGAQNNANSTTTVGIGATMDVVRLA